MSVDKEIKRVLEETADGSYTLFVPSLNEHYHSINGAIQESQHVFIDAGLKQCSKDEISVFEVGFGTGLNALLTAQYAEQSGKVIRYTSIEAYPLARDTIEQLNYGNTIDPTLYQKLHSAEWGVEEEISPNFYLNKIEADFTHFNFSLYADSFNVIYFDAFAPDVQEDMWTQEIFDSIYSICRSDATLTTYCAKGVVRRRMQSTGFVVERIPGPPGKREMLRARKA